MSTEPAAPRPFLLGLAESPRGAARAPDATGLFAEQLDTAARPTRTERPETTERARSSDGEALAADSPTTERASEPSDDQEDNVSREAEAPTEESPERDNLSEGEEVVATPVVTPSSELAETLSGDLVEFDPTADGEPAPQAAASDRAALSEATGDFGPELAAATEGLSATPASLNEGPLEAEATTEGQPTAEPAATIETSPQPTEAGPETLAVTPGTVAQVESDVGEQATPVSQQSAEAVDGEGTLSNPNDEGQNPEGQNDNAPSPIERVTAAAEESAEAAPEPTRTEASTASSTSTPVAVDTADSAADPIGPTAPTADLAGPTVEGPEPTRPAALSPGETPSVERPPAVDPSRFLTRVARAIDFANERGGGPIELRLSPPELGSLQVKIELREGVLTASLEAETPAARQTLLDNLPALRDRLEQQQIRIDKFDVDVRDDSGQRGGDYQPRDSDGRRSDGESDRREPAAPRTRTTTPEGEAAPSEPTRTIHFGDDTINLVA